MKLRFGVILLVLSKCKYSISGGYVKAIKVSFVYKNTRCIFYLVGLKVNPFKGGGMAR